MTSQDHPKHPKLLRPTGGQFGRIEWAIYGAPCSEIQALAAVIIRRLSDRYRFGYADARHDTPGSMQELPGFLAQGAVMEFTDAGRYRQITVGDTGGVAQNRNLFNGCDAVLVNGNHHSAAAQIVVIDPSKADSLKRRLEQLTNVRLFILKDELTPIYDFLEIALPDIKGIPRLPLCDTEAIIRFFEHEMQQKTPEINGLILAGGKSRRMGRDKSVIEWHGKPQRDYLAELLQPVCKEVFISCRPDQETEISSSGKAVLPDTFSDLGPFGAILSAFRAQPDKAWLVLACDLPKLDRATIDFLIGNRSVKNIATTFQSPGDQLPEPLIAIWEPKAYAVMLSFLAQGYSCPRKVLHHSDANIIVAPNPEALTNVNTPEDIHRLKQEPGT